MLTPAAAAKLESAEDENVGKYGAYHKGLPEYTLEDVSKHGTMEDRVWVSYRHGVYDITDFIAKHPGKIIYIVMKYIKNVDESSCYERKFS